MKAIKFLLSLLAVCLLGVGCTKKYITEEYITEQYITQGMDMSLIDFTVKAANWTYREVEYGNDDEGYFEAVLNVPEITKEVVEKGMVFVNRRYDEPNGAIFTPLPAERTEKTEDGLYYTTFVDFEWSQGRVNIFFTASDLYVGQEHTAPGEMYFRVAVQL